MDDPPVGLFTYEDRDRLIGETRVVGGSTTVYNIYYTYDQLGNRLTKTDTVAGLKTEYFYDVHGYYDQNYPTKNNRLTRYELRLLDDTLLRTVWYTYFVTGHVSNITIKDEWTGQGEAPPEYALYHDLALFYNINGTLAYALWDHWLVDEQGVWYDYGMDHAREFRFDGPTQRYMVRDINDLGNGWEITDTLWTDYDGGVGVSPANPYNDFTVTADAQGQPVVQEEMRYLAGFGIPAQQTVATGETRYLHGDLIRSTMLVRDELGNNQPTLAYTAFGEPVTPDGQGGWRVGYPPADPGTRYQYAGGWGYETGGSAQDPGGPSANSNMLALYGANPALPPIALQHVGARWYDPALGRFLQRDPAGLRAGLNAYVYGVSSPLVHIDPSGLSYIGTGLINRGLKWINVGGWLALIGVPLCFGPPPVESTGRTRGRGWRSGGPCWGAHGAPRWNR